MGFSVYVPALLQRPCSGYPRWPLGYAAGLEALGWTVAALAVGRAPAHRHGPIIRSGGYLHRRFAGRAGGW